MVRFNVQAEFLAEVMQDKDVIERKIVRVTALMVPSKITPVIRHVSVVATYKAAGEVVRFEHHVGDLWGNTSQDQAVLAKVNDQMQQITRYCEQTGLEVRSGMYE